MDCYKRAALLGVACGVWATLYPPQFLAVAFAVSVGVAFSYLLAPAATEFVLNVRARIVARLEVAR